MKHICINATEQNLAWRVNKQREGLRGIFDHSMRDVDDLDAIDIEFTLNNYIDQANAGDREEMKIIDEKLISENGHYIDENETVWLTIGTWDQFEHELKQEIEYQKKERVEE